MCKVLYIRFLQTFDAVVGDVTVLANRSTKVEFTQPYAESGLSMIVPAKSEESAWMFMRPFTWKMWLAVTCDGDSFVREYLENVLGFKSDNILNVSSEYNYQGEFKNNIIAAAFLEVPYEKVFITRHCEGYTATAPTYRFGGLGFVFQKGSPIAADFSKAILKLSENGVLKSLEEKWFAPSPECLANATNNKTESLTFSSFWGLYLISSTTSTICFILFLVRLLRNYRHDREDTSQNNIAPSMRSIWSEVVRLVKYICNREGMQNPGRVLTFAGPRDVKEWSSSRWEYTSPSDITDDLQESSEADVEMQYIPGCS
ncbi:hypothetical protein Q3G72_001351 [Acer saccharum]|nr:hypothetical protein Q3G72_001351 [Acer saccharum]